MDKAFLNVTSIGIGAPEVKLAHALFTNKKLPEEFAQDPKAEDYFVCEGTWAVGKLIEKKIAVKWFLVCPDGFKKDSELRDIVAMKNYAKKTLLISEKTCGKISDRDGADYCFIIAELPRISLEDVELKDNMTAIVLDGQEQPGNIGAILRTLDGAGGDFAVYTNRRCKMTHPRLIRASLGAAFTVPFACADFEELLAWLEKNNFKVIVTDLSATKNYYDIDYDGRVAIVCGNEYLGVSPVWREQPFAVPVIIPMLGSVESLNVGFASTLVAYECSLRQKGIIKRG